MPYSDWENHSIFMMFKEHLLLPIILKSLFYETYSNAITEILGIGDTM